MAENCWQTELRAVSIREQGHRKGPTGPFVVGEYVDQESGGTSKRAQFQRMFADAHTRKFDLVMFWSLDRFSREGVSATLNHLEKLTGFGVNWRSFTEEYLDSCGLFRDAVLSILATIAKQERVRRSERATAAILKLRGRPRLIVDRAKIGQLVAAGKSVRAAAAQLGISHATAHRAMRLAKLQPAPPERKILVCGLQ